MASSELRNREANYKFCLELFRKDPSKERQKELAQKQIIIDQDRKKLLLSTRWYTWKEIKDFEKDEDTMLAISEPREPLDIPKNDDDAVWAEKTKYYTENHDDVEFFATLTLDGLIEKLLAIREHTNGDTPVFRYEYCSYTGAVLKVSEMSDRITIN